MCVSLMHKLCKTSDFFANSCKNICSFKRKCITLQSKQNHNNEKNCKYMVVAVLKIEKVVRR